MSDQPEVTMPATDAPKPDAESHMIPRARLNEVLDRERKANERLAEFERKQAEADQAEAMKKGEFEKIIGELKPKAERLSALESVIADTLANEVAALPDSVAEQAKAILDLIPTPEGRLAALPKLRALVPSHSAKPTPPPLNGGDGKRPDGNALIPSPSDIEFAQAAGIPIEKYMKYKTKE